MIFLCVIVSLSARVERFAVSLIHDFFRSIKEEEYVLIIAAGLLYNNFSLFATTFVWHDYKLIYVCRTYWVTSGKIYFGGRIYTFFRYFTRGLNMALKILITFYHQEINFRFVDRFYLNIYIF